MTYSTTINTMNLSRGVLKNNLDRDISRSIVLKYVIGFLCTEGEGEYRSTRASQKAGNLGSFFSAAPDFFVSAAGNRWSARSIFFFSFSGCAHTRKVVLWCTICSTLDRHGHIDHTPCWAIFSHGVEWVEWLVTHAWLTNKIFIPQRIAILRISSTAYLQVLDF